MPGAACTCVSSCLQKVPQHGSYTTILCSKQVSINLCFLQVSQDVLRIATLIKPISRHPLHFHALHRAPIYLGSFYLFVIFYDGATQFLLKVHTDHAFIILLQGFDSLHCNFLVSIIQSPQFFFATWAPQEVFILLPFVRARLECYNIVDTFAEGRKKEKLTSGSGKSTWKECNISIQVQLERMVFISKPNQISWSLESTSVTPQ